MAAVAAEEEPLSNVETVYLNLYDQIQDFHHSGELRRAERLAYDLLTRADLPIVCRAGLHFMLATYDTEYLWHAEQAVFHYKRGVERCEAAIEARERKRDETDENLAHALAEAEKLVEEAKADKKDEEQGLRIMTVEERRERTLQRQKEQEQRKSEEERGQEERTAERAAEGTAGQGDLLGESDNEQASPPKAPPRRRRRKRTALPTPAPTSGPAAPSSPQTEPEAGDRTLASTRARRETRRPDRYMYQ